MTADRIEELQELKQEYILNETSLEIGQKSVSWGELADMEADAESRWNETEEGRELALLEAGESELTVELYKALKAASRFAYDHISGYSVKEGKEAVRVYRMCEDAIRKAEGDN